MTNIKLVDDTVVFTTSTKVSTYRDKELDKLELKIQSLLLQCDELIKLGVKV